jgi:hypothetical protein
MITIGPVDPEILVLGSVPLKDADAAINAVWAELGPHLRRMPDGETGERRNWIQFQYPRLAAHPAFEVDPDAAPIPLSTQKGGLVGEIAPLRFRANVDPDAATLDLGYAEAAKSYVHLAGLKRTGRVRPDVRFMVALPTPTAVTAHFISPAHRPRFAAWYERVLLAELDAIAHAIPHPDLAIQWDVAFEVFIWEGRVAYWGPEPKPAVLAALARLGRAVPETVELGYHLCYGDPGGHHVIEPKDTRVLTEIANGVSALVKRPIQWIHMPVPIERHDDAYFAPLAALALHPETRLVLGLVHDSDGEAGNAARIAAARRHVPSFGIATECGWGRRAPETLPELMRLHRQAAQALTR